MKMPAILQNHIRSSVIQELLGSKDCCQESEVTHNRSGINVGGEKVRGDAMQEAYKENQAKLHEHSSQGFGPQNELQRRVAEQRSENEHKINESAGEIGKKQSTVQASSDILKGELHNSQSSFSNGLNKEKIRQGNHLLLNMMMK
jgi:conjugal transfer mating pair stabilization protein TraG